MEHGPARYLRYCTFSNVVRAAGEHTDGRVAEDRLGLRFGSS